MPTKKCREDVGREMCANGAGLSTLGAYPDTPHRHNRQEPYDTLREDP